MQIASSAQTLLTALTSTTLRTTTAKATTKKTKIISPFRATNQIGQRERDASDNFGRNFVSSRPFRHRLPTPASLAGLACLRCDLCTKHGGGNGALFPTTKAMRRDHVYERLGFTAAENQNNNNNNIDANTKSIEAWKNTLQRFVKLEERPPY